VLADRRGLTREHDQRGGYRDRCDDAGDGGPARDLQRPEGQTQASPAQRPPADETRDREEQVGERQPDGERQQRGRQYRQRAPARTGQPGHETGDGEHDDGQVDHSQRPATAVWRHPSQQRGDLLPYDAPHLEHHDTEGDDRDREQGHGDSPRQFDGGAMVQPGGPDDQQ
jgi:hypothetical protein